MTFPLRPTRRVALSAIGAAAATMSLGRRPASAAPDPVRFLIAAPLGIPAFVDYNIAIARGYYQAQNLDVSFITVGGGAEVAKQVGAGNADLGGGIGDTPIIVQANGVPVRDVAIKGGHSLAKLGFRTDRGINDVKDLRGKTVAVLSYSDTTYYALLGVLAKFNMTKSDVNIVAAGNAGSPQLVVSGNADAMCGVGDWTIVIEEAGVPLKVLSCDDYFPTMAASIIASNDAIAKRPTVIRRFVRASIRGLRDVMNDPARAASDFVTMVPAYKGREAEIQKTVAFYVRNVYSGQKKLGQIDPARLDAVQSFYFKAGIIQKSTPVGDLYTNDFID
jgi:NitT/TauT family transport system substrate-binding protein